MGQNINFLYASLSVMSTRLAGQEKWVNICCCWQLMAKSYKTRLWLAGGVYGIVGIYRTIENIIKIYDNIF